MHDDDALEPERFIGQDPGETGGSDDDAPMRHEEASEDDNESDAADAPREADEEEIEERDDDDESTTPDAEDNADEDNEPGPNKTQKKQKKTIIVLKSFGQLSREKRVGRAGAKSNPFNKRRRGLQPRGHGPSRPPRRAPVPLKPSMKRGPFFQIGRGPEQVKKDKAAWKAKPKAKKDAKAARRAEPATGKWGERDIKRELAAALVYAKTQARIAEIDERRAFERAEAKRRAKAERSAKDERRAEAKRVEAEAATLRQQRRALGAAAAAPRFVAAPPLPADTPVPPGPVNWFELVGRQPRDESEPCTCDLDPCRCWSL